MGRRRNPTPCRSWLLGGLLLLAALLALAAGTSQAQTLLGEKKPAGVTETTSPTTSPTATPTITPTSCPPSWVIVPSPSQQSQNVVRAISAVAANDVWAVGQLIDNGTLIEHWDGAQWSVVPSPNSGSYVALAGVSALATDDVWAVGYGSHNLIEHWDGTQWSVVSSPTPPSLADALYAVSALSTNDVWAVGVADYGNTSSPLIEHWNGKQWSIMSASGRPTDYSELLGVVALSADDVWAVGEHVSYFTGGPLIEHWNGTSWSAVSTPTSGYADILAGIAAVSPDDIWAVGSYQTYNPTTPNALIEHWDGTQWSIVAGPSAAWKSLEGVTALSANDVWAVGQHDNYGTLVEHWDGTTWSVVPSPNPQQNTANLAAVSVVSSTDIWAAGNQTSSEGNAVLFEHYSTACLPPTPTPTACPIQFSDVPPGSTFYDYIRCLACRGIVTGYSDGTFRPNNLVTRGQACKIDILSVGIISPVPPTQQTFEDVPPGSTFWLYIERAAERRYVTGYPCGGNPSEPCVPPQNRPYFRPNGPATRGQAAQIIERSSGFAGPPVGQTFEDVPTGSTFYTSVQVLSAQDSILSGYPCGNPEPCVPPENRPYFRPYNNTTRGQFAKIAGRLFYPECSTPSRKP